MKQTVAKPPAWVLLATRLHASAIEEQCLLVVEDIVNSLSPFERFQWKVFIGKRVRAQGYKHTAQAAKQQATMSARAMLSPLTYISMQAIGALLSKNIKEGTAP